MAKRPENTYIWDALSQTNPKFTKTFKRAGGFEGTAQNPTYAIQKMTEFFGPCGKGWGTGKPEFTFINGPNGQILVFCTTAVWYLDGGQRFEVWGVGGDSAVIETKYGVKIDDEACKKATTDSLTNAMKQIGMAADIHLGMFDDSKYVNDTRKQFEKEEFGEAKKRQEEVKNDKLSTLKDQPTSINSKEPPLISASKTKEEFLMALSVHLVHFPKLTKPQRKAQWQIVAIALNKLTGNQKEYQSVLTNYGLPRDAKGELHASDFGSGPEDLRMEMVAFEEMWKVWWDISMAQVPAYTG